MVSANGGAMTVLKARFGNDIRRTTLHHANDLTLNDLVLMLQRIFAISSDDVVLKYRDSDGDFITIGDDSDLLLALHEVTLFVEVIVGSASSAGDLFEQINKIQEDVARLSVLAQSFAASQDVKPVAKVPIYNGGDANTAFNVPSSPVPSEKAELPATIHPSLQEEVTSHHDSIITSSDDTISAPLEQEIPLDAQDAFAPPVPDPHVQQTFAPVPPPAAIPSFPNSNMPAPIQPEAHYGFPGGVPGAPGGFAAPPQQPPTPHSSVSSTPIPQQSQQFAPPPPQHQGFAPQQGFAPPPPQQGFAAPAPQQGFAPPSHPGFPPHAGGAPPQAPQGFAPPSGPGPQFGAPPAPQGGMAPPPGPQGFAPPQTPQQNFAPPAPQPGQQPQSHQFAPPAQPNFAPSFGNSPPQMGAPSEPAPPQHPGAPNFAHPPMGGPMGAPPQMGAPQMGAPPMGGPPMGGPGMPGGNPFARGGPPFRQSPYHQ